MDSDLVLLSDELLAVLRGAVTYALGYGRPFIGPAHLLLALLDDPQIGEPLCETLERERLLAAAQAATGAALEVHDGELPRGESSPFARYDTLVFQSVDGRHQRWLDRNAFKLFNDSVKHVRDGRFLPKHLALGYANVHHGDGDIRALLGDDPERFSDAAFAL